MMKTECASVKLGITENMYFYWGYILLWYVNIYLGPPTPGSKSALAQLLASVQSTGESRSTNDATRQIKQSLQHQAQQKQQQQQEPARRKRSVQRQNSQQQFTNPSGLTPTQQKKLQLLMQQQQPQQGSLSTGQIVLGQQPLVGNQGRYEI